MYPGKKNIRTPTYYTYVNVPAVEHSSLDGKTPLTDGELRFLGERKHQNAVERSNNGAGGTSEEDSTTSGEFRITGKEDHPHAEFLIS